MQSYIERFESAAFRSTILYGNDLNPTLCIDSSRSAYERQVVNAIVADFKDGVVSSAEMLPGNCFGIVREASYVLFEMDIDNAVTIGTVSANGKPHFSTTLQSIEHELEEGFNSTPANAHAWLTLDTGQILDPTILPSWAYHDENRMIQLDNAIYLSGLPCEVSLFHEPYVTGFAYHLGVVTHPAQSELFKRYSDWLRDSGVFKRNIAKKRRGG